MLCYQENFFSPTKPVDEAQFAALVGAGKWKDTIDKFRETGDQSLKRKLPAFIFQATFDETTSKTGKKGRWRKQSAARLNGLVVMDIDHVENPQAKFEEWKALDFVQLGILLVYITPSGKGLKVVSSPKEETTDKDGKKVKSDADTQPTTKFDPTVKPDTVIESYSGYRAVWLAKVMNMNQNPVYIRSGSLQVKDAEGNLVGSATYLSNRGSYYLEPGETTFVSMEADIPENIEVTCERALEVSPNPYRKDFALTAADSDFTFGEGDYATSWMQTTVTNQTENPATPQVIFCLEDAEGTPWLVEETSLYRHELTSGSSLIMKQNLDDRFVKMLKEKGVEITTIEAYAWCEIED